MKFDLGQSMLAEYDADGFLGIQHDVFGEEDSGAPAAEMHAPYGFLSMPLDPEKDASGQATSNACSVLYGWEGSRVHVWPLQDPRVTPKLPKLVKGGSMQYCATGAYDYFDGVTGSKTIYVPYAFVNGTPTKSMSVELNVDTAGQESISIIHGDGMSFTMSQGSIVLKNASGATYLEVGANGGVLSGSWSVPGGLAVGSVAGAQPLVSAPKLIALLQSLISILAATGPAASGAPAAALASQLAGLATQNTRGT